VSDPIQVQVLQFYLIVVPQPPEEAMRGRREPAHMEVDKKDVVAIRRLWLPLAAGHEPYVGGTPPSKKPALDEAL